MAKKRTRVVRSEKEIKTILSRVRKLKRGEKTAFYQKNGISSSHINNWQKRFAA